MRESDRSRLLSSTGIHTFYEKYDVCFASGYKAHASLMIHTRHDRPVLCLCTKYTYCCRVGNSSLLGHCPFGLDVNLIFKGTEASWEGTKATFHPSPGAPRPV